MKILLIFNVITKVVFGIFLKNLTDLFANYQQSIFCIFILLFEFVFYRFLGVLIGFSGITLKLHSAGCSGLKRFISNVKYQLTPRTFHHPSHICPFNYSKHIQEQ